MHGPLQGQLQYKDALSDTFSHSLIVVLVSTVSLAKMLALRLAAAALAGAAVPSPTTAIGSSMRGARELCMMRALATLCRRAAFLSGSTAPRVAAASAAALAATSSTPFTIPGGPASSGRSQLLSSVVKLKYCGRVRVCWAMVCGVAAAQGPHVDVALVVTQGLPAGGQAFIQSSHLSIPCRRLVPLALPCLVVEVVWGGGKGQQCTPAGQPAALRYSHSFPSSSAEGGRGEWCAQVTLPALLSSSRMGRWEGTPWLPGAPGRQRPHTFQLLPPERQVPALLARMCP